MLSTPASTNTMNGSVRAEACSMSPWAIILSSPLTLIIARMPP